MYEASLHPIPKGTPAPRLRRLLGRYAADPDLPIPSGYRLRMLARIVALIAATPARHLGPR